MSVRIYIVILFSWALLTAVTPTLVRLAASANLQSRLDGEGREGLKLLLPRKALVELNISVPVLAVAATPVPAAAYGGGGAILEFRRRFDRSRGIK
ncbi:hypothetical protein SASPL_106292 [Salvia splendens]|uniref:Uncharacterized protein n=1 Tax=Salvia splendens TaxID=180675 RepID=A0A8X9AA44_SALSN|nr:hypothetical protein SASPL_106292 [Salvia splendens]